MNTKLKPISGHYLDKIVMVILKKEDPTHKRVYRWITSRKGDRFYARAPKRHVMIRELFLKRDADYGPERILPVDAKIYSMGARSRKHIH